MMSHSECEIEYQAPKETPQKMPNLLRDDGDKGTVGSLDFWKEHKRELGTIESVMCFKTENFFIKPEKAGNVDWLPVASSGWATIIKGDEAVMVLTGLSTGYSGTGSAGLEALCHEAGFQSVRWETIRDAKGHFVWTKAMEEAERARTDRYAQERGGADVDIPHRGLPMVMPSDLSTDPRSSDDY